MSKAPAIQATLGGGLGIIVLLLLSLLQKVLVGGPPFEIKGYTVPILVGGAGGAIIGYLSWRKRCLFVEELQLEIDARETLEERVEQRTSELSTANQRHCDEIAERRRVERTLVETERKKVVAETAGAAAHEINQPLTVILGESELLQNCPTTEELPIRRVEANREAALRISDIGQKMVNVHRYVAKHYTADVNIVDFEASAEGQYPQEQGQA